MFDPKLYTCCPLTEEDEVSFYLLKERHKIEIALSISIKPKEWNDIQQIQKILLIELMDDKKNKNFYKNLPILFKHQSTSLLLISKFYLTNFTYEITSKKGSYELKGEYRGNIKNTLQLILNRINIIVENSYYIFYNSSNPLIMKSLTHGFNFQGSKSKTGELVVWTIVRNFPTDMDKLNEYMKVYPWFLYREIEKWCAYYKTYKLVVIFDWSEVWYFSNNLYTWLSTNVLPVSLYHAFEITKLVMYKPNMLFNIFLGIIKGCMDSKLSAMVDIIKDVEGIAEYVDLKEIPQIFGGNSKNDYFESSLNSCIGEINESSQNIIHKNLKNM